MLGAFFGGGRNGSSTGRFVEGIVPPLIPRPSATSPGRTHSICTAPNGIWGRKPSKRSRSASRSARCSEGSFSREPPRDRATRGAWRVGGGARHRARGMASDGVPAYANLVEALAPKCARAAISMESGWFQSKWLGRARSTFAGDVGPARRCFALELSTEESRGYSDQRRRRAHAEPRSNGRTLPSGRRNGAIHGGLRPDRGAGRTSADPRMATGLVFLKSRPSRRTGALGGDVRPRL